MGWLAYVIISLDAHILHDLVGCEDDPEGEEAERQQTYEEKDDDRSQLNNTFLHN